MLWAPAPQPAHDRVSLWIGTGPPSTPPYIVKIEQKVTTQTIQAGETYYLDFIGSINAANYNNGTWDWPVPALNLVVNLYWLAPGQDDIHSGTQGLDWDLITKLEKTVYASLGEMAGHWHIAQTSFKADASLEGKSFYVQAYGQAPCATFEEIFLSKQPPQDMGPFTYFDCVDNFGDACESDLDGDCDVDANDLRPFAAEWLKVTTAFAASSSQGKFGPGEAYDGDRFQAAAGKCWKVLAGKDSWFWQIDFSTPVNIGSILMIMGEHESVLDNSPDDYIWQYSDNGVNWYNIPETQQSNERRLFRIQRPDETVNAAHFRLVILDCIGNYPTLREIELYSETDS